MVRSALRVATIEDDAVDRLMVHRLLSQDPSWTVDFVEFSSGEEAIEKLPASLVDVVLLDSDLGTMTGVEVLKGLKAQKLEVPVIALTRQGDDCAAVSLLQAGAIDTIPKSKISTSSLQRAITNAIEKQSLRSAVCRFREELDARNDELEAQKREVEAFYHTLSHELKTPLTSMREFICLMAEGVAGPVTDDQAEYLDACKISCDQLKRTMDDLIDLSRIETGKFSIQKQPVEIGELLAEVVRWGEIRAVETAITVTVESIRGAVLADRYRAKQVLVHLFDNALSCTPEGGSIHLEAIEENEHQIVFSVSDTGRGMALAEQETIFTSKPLSAVSAPLDCSESEGNGREPSGLGLGLNLCKELVELHGGAMWLESTPGTGSVFSFTLPIAKDVLIPG